MNRFKTTNVVIGLQMLILTGQWLGTPRYLTQAQAQLADPGRDRAELIDQLRAVNTKLDKMVDILASGKLQVRAVVPDEAKGSTPAR